MEIKQNNNSLFDIALSELTLHPFITFHNLMHSIILKISLQKYWLLVKIIHQKSFEKNHAMLLKLCCFQTYRDVKLCRLTYPISDSNISTHKGSNNLRYISNYSTSRFNMKK